MKDAWAKITATVFYVGYLKPAPGTWGSLAALPMAWLIYTLGGLWLFVLAIPAAYIKGYYATLWMTQGQDNHDPSEIVIDEVVGQWIALLPVFVGAAHAGVDVLALWPGWVAAFVLFRLFDITKPGPVGWADRKDNATGVMLDDVIAGVLAAICVGALAGLFHGAVG
ncbi:phosphatidylglycerophosphatase A family protein [Pseudooctadecabacter jejudonensis]|uniref:Phosphatidylglycerophosphatase A n=1 Tax=Pseudooctadecabacter jejudonensis TaxID=1391910 RepID=A0A1Y5RF22_9RHOB|nr:phosphatidylglycerophosphatase A [Pseudooctadecabacter jejudonensis]SLN15748.1 Phosphatidylglycerophosphatase A [Pseudooctadecabacter jejudonensis]